MTFRGRIDFNGERDSHTFVASTRNPHVIETSLGTLSDSVIYLYDAMGRTLASDDDGGVGLASRIVYNCTPGATYRVGVEGYMNRALGSYTLRITGNAGGGQFPLPQVGGGRLTVNGIARRGRITFGGDTDSYQFVASTRNPHVIETTLGTLSDSVLQLHDAMGRQIAYNDDDRAVGLASRITYNCTPGATYTVRVRGFSRRHTGTYSVRVRTFGGIAPLPPAPVPPIRPRRWPPVAPRQLPTTGLSSSGRLTGGADEDWYRFVASARNPHVIETTLGSLNDSYIYLYDAKGRQLANDDDGGVGLASKINYFCTAGRTYHVKVRAWGGGAGTYTVRVQATGRRPKSLPGPRPDPRPSTRGGRPPLAFNGRLDFNNDSDWYTFTASTRNPHVIETSLGTLSDSVIELYSATGTRPLVTDDDDGPGLASRIVHRCTPGRTYRVRVRAFGGRTGTYTLRITTFGR